MKNFKFMSNEELNNYYDELVFSTEPLGEAQEEKIAEIVNEISYEILMRTVVKEEA